MHSKSLTIPLALFALLLAGQARAQQAFDLPAAPKDTSGSSPATVPVATSPSVAVPEASAPAAPPADVFSPTPAKVTAAATPKPKKPKKAPASAVARFYSGHVHFTGCDNEKAFGTDTATGRTIVVKPRFRGVYVGCGASFTHNRILVENEHGILIAPEPGNEDYGPYVPPPNTGQVVGGVISTAGSVLGILNSISR
jgi:hypothetical protein